MGKIITSIDQDLLAEIEGSAKGKATDEDLDHHKAQRLWIDGHVDLPYFMKKYYPEVAIKDLQEGPVTLEKAVSTGVRLFVSAIYCQDEFNGQASQLHFEENLAFALNHYKGLHIIRHRQELEEVRNDTQSVATLFLLENADFLADDLSRAEELRSEGFFAIGLTHRNTNRLADGDAADIAQGLSKVGKELLSIMMDHSLVLDISHLHPKCFWQVLDSYEGPIFCSHTGLSEKYEIPRNITLAQCKELFDRQGVVGISFNPELLGPECKGEAEEIFAHLDTVVQRFGPRHVAIGSDLGGFVPRSDGPFCGLEGFEALARIMLDHGYGDSATEKILGLNWLAFFEKVL